MARLSVWVLAGLAASVGSSRPVLAQSAPPAPASAQQVQQVRDQLDQLRKDFETERRLYDQRLAELEARLHEVEAGPSGPSAAATPASSTPAGPAAPAPAPAAPTTPAALMPASLPDPVAQPGDQGAGAQSSQVGPGASKVFNPDMSAIGNFVGYAGKNEMVANPSMQLTEAEIAFQAIVDPYARADFFLSAGPEGLDVEEGYVTFTSLPASLLLKVGKMRAQFGKVNTLHTHAMPTVDRPLVTENLVGGEDGLSDWGMSLAHLLPTKAVFLELTGEVYSGNSNVFQSDSRSKLNYVGRVRAYRDLTEATNIDLGTSFAYGPTDVGQSTTMTAPTPSVLNKTLYGIDATFRYRPLRRAIYQRLNLRTELIWSRQDLPSSMQTTAFGWYGLAEYQFARRWYVGGRYDRSGRPLDGSLVDNGGSVFLTYWPSEFSQIRGQYRATNYSEGIFANEFLFQFNFAIGAHGAHVF
ncbi:MAG TPA: hypothetical protein VLT86_15350 [Vicinamibacterales bacterium]|nr:hypothetical protein [Vicinamibacterales bacterium]